ncbi:alpha-glucosidase family protein [Luteimonas sp. SX5]|uniref:Alpha-glucosidase family protein n=1 Tax=Luteimonas galliterrae TaxID=2940486 RepID=A0ABT0MED4_9GAMM|nr:alpha-glucosidase family protein [Luteimonas galliterrae]MCL1633038.1 alpha-glucosidase family protein [Luteimonas galliterrae]
MATLPWWRGAVIYQIYPRSFMDTDGNGVGDLPGIVAKLDYIASLGVDAIWISPFFKSPMADFGYDIADYRDVDPLFGTLGDFDRLLAKAHALGIRVMIDQVLSHTSIEHDWFRQSRASRDNDKADWYVWADPRPDGTPPNNWLSIFGGVAWKWEPRRRQYFLHNFLASQPDLNFHNPAVREATLDNVRFWLDKGVDGLRLDAINFCFHDLQLRDNPAKPAELRQGRGFSPDNPYAFQYHHHNNTQPENLRFLEELRALIDRYPQATTLGEISSEDSLATMGEYVNERRLHMGYSFELLTEDFSAAYIRGTVENLEIKMADGWPCWAISNHDVQRAVSRWGGADADDAFAKQLIALVCSLRGSVCLYQGEELGLGEAEVPYEALRDPYGIAFWPNFKGRDGCRTPMPWTGDADAGFGSEAPWLPIPAEHRARNVAAQDANPASVLNAARAFLRWRKTLPALLHGDIRFLDAPEPILAFTRHLDGATLLVVFNLSSAAVRWPLPAGAKPLPLASHGPIGGRVEKAQLSLPGRGVFFAELTGSVLSGDTDHAEGRDRARNARATLGSA